MFLKQFSLSLTALCCFSSFASSPDSHAPIGVMGDHLHKAGEWMVSYRFMQMQMEDNLYGDEDISADDIVTEIENRFGTPATLRVVPTEMTTDMHMFGLMYAPTDNITLMAMLNLIEKDMDHLTYQGMSGTTQLGTFNTKSDGIGDTKLGLLYGLVDSPESKLHLNFSISIPTGSIENTDDILTPMSETPTVRLPYAMQLGSGTWDVQPGITYKGFKDQYSWGAQAKYLTRLDDNDEGYSLGDKFTLSGWAGYEFNHTVAASLRLTYTDQDSIDGIDEEIALPVQTADPDNYGGTRVDVGMGVNFVLPGHHRLALEYEVPIHQDVNGVQMKMQSMLTLGYQYAF